MDKDPDSCIDLSYLNKKPAEAPKPALTGLRGIPIDEDGLRIKFVTFRRIPVKSA